MRRCTRCGRDYDDDSKLCRTCGRILEMVVEQPQDGIPFAPADASRDSDRAGPPLESRDEADSIETTSVQPPDQVLADQPASDSSPLHPWTCGKCRESVPANFDICWSCGTARDGIEDPEFVVAEVVSDENGGPLYLDRQDNGIAYVDEEVLSDTERDVPHCARCGSREVIPRAVVSTGDSRVKAVVFGNPESLVFKEPLFGDLSATICARCGHVELHATNARALYQRYLDSLGR